ncbi:MAG: hypothetical protein ACRELF_01820 [Gemmataceae bacterium]
MPAVRSRGRADDASPKPRSDAYVGLLGLSLLALSAAMLFAFLNWQGIADQPKAVQMAPTGGGGRTPGPPVVNPPVRPAQPGAPQPGVPPPGGKQPPPPAQPPKNK